MSAEELLKSLTSGGWKVGLTEDHQHVKVAGKPLPEELRGMVRAVRNELLSLLLRAEEPTAPPGAALPDDLRRWPPGPRYRVAMLERQGRTRAEAVATVRALPGVDLPPDRDSWPREAQVAFWSLVKQLNADARAKGVAVNGVSPFALAAAERAVREAWARPLFLDEERGA